MEYIGIMGGTFDPPHIGHLITAEIVRDKLELDEIWFIPTHEPPHKENTKTSVTDRVNMLSEAIHDNPFFKIETIELERSGKSYTIDTINTLLKRHLHKKFFFIIGADMVDYLPRWQRIDELIKLITFVGVQRKGYELKSIYPITKVDIPMIDISSTKIRAKLMQDKTVKYLIPERVVAYIKEHQVYGD